MNTKQSKKLGKVYLVGAGPGDPGLITVKGLKCLRKADVIVYDRLVDETILGEARKSAEKIYVGRQQATIRSIRRPLIDFLIDKARKGKRSSGSRGGPFCLGPWRGRGRGAFSNKIPLKWFRESHQPCRAGLCRYPVTHRGVASSLPSLRPQGVG